MTDDPRTIAELHAEVERLRASLNKHADAIDTEAANLTKAMQRAERAEAEVERLRAAWEAHRSQCVELMTDEESDAELRRLGMDPEKLRGEGERIIDVSQRALEQRCRAERAEADLAEAVEVVRLAYEDETNPQVHDMTVEEWDAWLARASALLAKHAPGKKEGTR